MYATICELFKIINLDSLGFIVLNIGLFQKMKIFLCKIYKMYITSATQNTYTINNEANKSSHLSLFVLVDLSEECWQKMINL